MLLLLFFNKIMINLTVVQYDIHGLPTLFTNY